MINLLFFFLMNCFYLQSSWLSNQTKIIHFCHVKLRKASHLHIWEAETREFLAFWIKKVTSTITQSTNRCCSNLKHANLYITTVTMTSGSPIAKHHYCAWFHHVSTIIMMISGPALMLSKHLYPLLKWIKFMTWKKNSVDLLSTFLHCGQHVWWGSTAWNKEQDGW